jgi:putative oxidoreductase
MFSFGMTLYLLLLFPLPSHRNPMNPILLLSAVLRPSQTSSSAFQAGWTVLRVVIGIMMVHNGLDKLSDIESFAQAYVVTIGLPFPIFFSYVAALTETIGAPLLILGLFTRPAALGLFSTMCVAMYHHVLVAGLNLTYLELSAVYAACFLFFALNGAGAVSMDNWLVGQIKLRVVTAQAQQLQSLENSVADGSPTKAGAGLK